MFKPLRISTLGITLTVCLLMILHIFTVINIAPVSAFQRFLYDQHLLNNMPHNKDNKIVIANIDEASIAELGQWPWRRDVLATLIDTLFDHYQINALGFDMVFAEPSDNTGQEVLDLLASSEALAAQPIFNQAYNALAPQLNFDQQMAESLTDRNIVLGIVFESSSKTKAKAKANTNQLPPPLLSLPSNIAENNSLVVANSYVANLPMFHQYAPRAGFFQNPLLDSDGVFRRVPLVQRIQEHIYPSLALQLARVALGINNIDLSFNTIGQSYQLQNIKLGDYQIKVGPQGEVFIPYRGYQNSFTYLSIVDILHKRVELSALQGKTLLVGTNSVGLLDLRTTPFSNAFPGVEVHANILSGILDRRLQQQPEAILSYELLAVLLTTLLILFITSLRSLTWQLVSLIALVFAILLISQWCWLDGFIIPTAPVLSLCLSLFVVLTVTNMLTEAKHKQSIVKQFGLYVPPDLVDKMAQAPNDYTSINEYKELTVLFADIRDFTAISEGLTPQALSQLMNRYLSVMTKVIHQYNGTIDKYMGDAIMAFWGAPVANANHAQDAAKAAMAMLAELPKLNQEFAQQGWPEVKIGIGINTDQMFVGNMGSDFRMAYTVMGDAVNLSSRLEGLTKQYGVDCLIGENVYQQVITNDLNLHELDKVRVKGKTQPVAIYQLSPANQDNITSAFDAFLDLYRSQQWQLAQTALNQLYQQKKISVTLFNTFSQRINHYQNTPPGDNWDGVYTHLQK